jgi:hypothetical protein
MPSVLVEAGSAMDIVSVGLVTIATILKRRRKNVRIFG